MTGSQHRLLMLKDERKNKDGDSASMVDCSHATICSSLGMGAMQAQVRLQITKEIANP